MFIISLYIVHIILVSRILIFVYIFMLNTQIRTFHDVSVSQQQSVKA